MVADRESDASSCVTSAKQGNAGTLKPAGLWAKMDCRKRVSSFCRLIGRKKHRSVEAVPLASTLRHQPSGQSAAIAAIVSDAIRFEAEKLRAESGAQSCQRLHQAEGPAHERLDTLARRILPKGE